MDREKVIALSKLARVDISQEEAENLAGEFEAILGYVGEVKQAYKGEDMGTPQSDMALKNILREDAEPHESGLYTKNLLAQAPETEGEYIKVKKILG
ncbi:MAG: aspartyl/glutamyl-tRNA(Asn/Gln) amidotransferase, C subunit [Parcubacteria bacterium C7867-005]|nr:MAG: aspartyl/glutamyl-tRNA(Asn/Gln) amidotransferase, C subunit [Parcubacteria bacterium C7867-005]